jgi:hypothetical protein
MFWIILFVVFTVWLVIKNVDDDVGLLFSIVFGALFSGFAVFMLATVANMTLPTTTQTYTVPIYSAASKGQLSGNFVFGSGSINSVDKYSTFVKSGKGKKKYTFDAGPVSVIETNKDVPHITIQYEKVTDSWWAKLVDVEMDRGHKVIEMVVPEGSVTASFNIE